MSDIQLTCVEHRGTFIFTQGEQNFYEKNGYTKPKRCRECRQKKKARMDSPFAGVLKQVRQHEQE